MKYEEYNNENLYKNEKMKLVEISNTMVTKVVYKDKN